MNNRKNKAQGLLNSAMVVIFILALATYIVLLVKVIENHRKNEELFAMDYYLKEETYKAYNDVFNFYEGKISKDKTIELGKLVQEHNKVSRKDIYQIVISLESMRFYLKDDIDYSKFEECIQDEYYNTEFKYDETTTLICEIKLSKASIEEIGD